MLKKIINAKVKSGFLLTTLFSKIEIQVLYRNKFAYTTSSNVYTKDTQMKDSRIKNLKYKKLKISFLQFTKNFKAFKKA